MLKLSKKYNTHNIFNIGDVLKIFYIVFLKTKKKKKKMYSFVGLCTYKNKDVFILKNVVNSEKITIKFFLNSPLIYKKIILNIYRKLFFTITKINLGINIKFKDDFKNKNNVILSNYDSFKKNYMYSGMYKKEIFKIRKKIRKFRRKYFNTEN